MTKILKFTKSKKPYSEKFLTNVKPEAIGDFIKGQNPGMSVRAADAMALAIIYSTYLCVEVRVAHGAPKPKSRGSFGWPCLISGRGHLPGLPDVMIGLE